LGNRRGVDMKAKLKSKAIVPIVLRSEDHLSNAIRRLRKIQGLSQIDLAKKAGITQPTVSRIEQGSKSTAVGTLFLIFAALGVDLQIVSRVQSSTSNSIEGLL
jgi:HTH-type transcriptional regulator / antitoxin HipB